MCVSSQERSRGGQQLPEHGRIRKDRSSNSELDKVVTSKQVEDLITNCYPDLSITAAHRDIMIVNAEPEMDAKM